MDLKKLKEELLYILYLFIALFIVFWVVFYNENIITLFRTVFAIFWLFILPGYIILLNWQKDFNFIERIIAGAVLGAGIVSLISYYLTLINIPIHIQHVLVPILIEAIALMPIVIKKYKKDKKIKKD